MSLKYPYKEYAVYKGAQNRFGFPDSGVEHFFHLPIDSQIRDYLIGACADPTCLPWSQWAYEHYISFQRQFRAMPLCGANSATTRKDAFYRGMMPIKQLGNLLKQIALLPAPPRERLLTIRVISTGSVSVFHLQHSLLLIKNLVRCIDRLNPQLNIGRCYQPIWNRSPAVAVTRHFGKQSIVSLSSR
jgi:hypothetical protein